MIKKLVPVRLRLPLRLLSGHLIDLLKGTRFKMAGYTPERSREGSSYPVQITIEQPINRSRYAANKIHNINLALRYMQNLAILPGEIFSFWKLAGNPNQKRGYQPGINIINSQLAFDTGGGLCQLSGLIYHLAISAGLAIVERFPHSVDLYTDDTRYTPLGADATIAYGYKDLRISNNLPFPVCFRISVENQRISGTLCAPQKIKTYELVFEKDIIDGKETVTTIRRIEGGGEEILNTSIYLISDHDETI